MLGFKKKKNITQADEGVTASVNLLAESAETDAYTAESAEKPQKTTSAADAVSLSKQSEVYIDEEAARILAEVAEYENTSNRYRNFDVKDTKPKKAEERVDRPALELIDQLHSEMPVRLSASKEEKLGARMLRDFLNKELGEPARMEPFDVRPMAGRQGLTAYAAVFGLAFVSYIVFAPAAAVISGLLIAMLLVQVFYNGDAFDKLFPKKTSYNVAVTVKGAKKEGGKTIILGASYDSPCGSPADLKLPEKLKPRENTLAVLDTAAFVSVCALCLLSVIKTVLYYATPMYGYPSAGRTAIFLLAALFTAFGSAYMAIRSLPFKKYGKRDSESIVSAAVAVGAAKYFSAHKKELGDCRLTVILTGSGNAGAKGSAAFVKRHFNEEEFENSMFIGLGNLLYGEYAVITGDRRVKYDEGLVNNALDAFEGCGAATFCSAAVTDATAFAQKGIPAVTVTKIKRAAVKKTEDAAALAQSNSAAIENKENEAEQELQIEEQCRAVINLIKAVAKK